uniref:ATP synthase complex subunit 8 n=1 Tax=Scaphidema metallicum TaxID=1586539 RepID=A0A343C3N4_9CUCU|nr:ATP synthase F0 subunit 8 [Scaphidema metallicum]
MPQMAPLNWVTLMVMTITMLLIFNIKSFYTLKQSINKTTHQIKNMKINWKW